MTSYTPKTKPMEHQLRARAASAAKPPGPDVFAFLMDMGTGKSKVVLDEWAEGALNGGPRDLLVVAPAGSYRNWFEDKSDEQPSEINRHLSDELREALVDAAWVSGGNKTVKERLRAMMQLRDKKRPRAMFVNVEALSSVEAARELCTEFIEQRGAYMAVDESTTIKSYSSQRTKHVIKIGSGASVRRIMSGLWTPQSPMDLYSQCEFLDKKILGCGSFFSFRAKYAVLKRMEFGGRSVPTIVGYRNLDQLQERVAPYSFRVLKSECLDLEPKVYTTRDVESTPEQLRMYKEIKHFGHAAIGDTGKFVTTDMVIKQIMRIHQINCGYIVDDEDRVLHEVPEKRTDALVEVLQEHQGKAIIWAPFRYAIDKIVQRLTKEFGPKSVAQFHGGNVKSRPEEERRFLGDPECRFMVATQAAGMRGNTWVVADLVVYYANNYDLEQRDQSEDRAHRKGQVNRVTYVDLICRSNPVDQKIVTSLRKKIDMATLINREGYREWLV